MTAKQAIDSLDSVPIGEVWEDEARDFAPTRVAPPNPTDTHTPSRQAPIA